MEEVAAVDLERFGVSPERGFLPAPDPLRRLPARYGPWEELAVNAEASPPPTRTPSD